MEKISGLELARDGEIRIERNISNEFEITEARTEKLLLITSNAYQFRDIMFLCKWEGEAPSINNFDEVEPSGYLEIICPII